MKKSIGLVMCCLGVIFGWHLLASSGANEGDVCLDANLPPSYLSGMASNATCRFSIKIATNPLTDVVRITVPGPRAFGITDPDLAFGFKNGFAKEFSGAAERQFSDHARENFDLYAMVLPYRVISSPDDEHGQLHQNLSGGRSAPQTQELHNDSNQLPTRRYKAPNVDISAPNKPPFDVEADRACAVDFRNIRMSSGYGDYNVLLKDGTYEEKGQYEKENVTLDHVFCLNRGTGEEYALVVTKWTGCGASCSSSTTVQLFTVRARRPVITQQFSFDSDALGTGTKFDEESLTLTITGRSDDDSGRCCPDNLDVVTYRWQESKFEQRGYERVPAQQ